MAVFDHEKLHVYQYAVNYMAFAYGLMQKLENQHRDLRDELFRSSQSIPLNIAAGTEKRSSQDRDRFYEIAQESALESAANLDLLVAVDALTEADIEKGKQMLQEISKMLSGRTGAFSGGAGGISLPRHLTTGGEPD